MFSIHDLFICVYVKFIVPNKFINHNNNLHISFQEVEINDES